MFFKKKSVPSVKNAGVIVAAGSGTRMGTDLPKQFLDVFGMPVIVHTLKKFNSCNSIHEIVIVTKEEFIPLCHSLVETYDLNKVVSIVVGGKTRQISVCNGINSVSDDVENVFIHDAARPLVSVETIEKCASVLSNEKACAVGVPMKDTIKYSSDGRYIQKTVDRSLLWQIQTPQCFKKHLALQLHKRALDDGFEATDDCMIFEHYGENIAIVEGEYENIKITSPQDIFVMKGILGDKI